MGNCTGICGNGGVDQTIVKNNKEDQIIDDALHENHLNIQPSNQQLQENQIQLNENINDSHSEAQIK